MKIKENIGKALTFILIVTAICVIVYAILFFLVFPARVISKSLDNNNYIAELDKAAENISVKNKTGRITKKGNINSKYYLYIGDEQLIVPQKTYASVEDGDTIEYLEYSVQLPQNEELTGIAYNSDYINETVKSEIDQRKQSCSDGMERDILTIKGVFPYMIWITIAGIIFLITLRILRFRK